MAKSIRIPLAGLALATLALAAAAQSSDAQAAQMRDYHIESQPLPAAVNDWADQAGMQVMWSAQMPGAQREAPEVAGRFSAPVALERVLQGSGLTFAFLDEQTVAIRLASVAGQSSSSTGAVGSEVRSPSPSQGEGTGEDLKRGDRHGEDSKHSVRGADAVGVSKTETISEVIVTGTHLRTGAPVGSPIHTYSRQDINASGALSTAQFIELLPQNFGGGVSEDTASSFVPSNGRTANNLSHGTGVNLRGLGSDATLLLLNGHRLTQTGFGDFVDVSQIPISAIDHIDVLTDGASAIYGSDAVAGVVNIVLKNNFDGAEARARYGSVTDGSFSKAGAGLTFGRAWGGGSALLSYDFEQQDDLSREDRPFALLPLGDLIPEKEAHQFVLNGRQRIGAVRLSYDALYAHRSTEFIGPRQTDSIGPDERREGPSETYSAYLGLDVPIAGEWEASVGALYSASHVVSENSTLVGVKTNRSVVKNDLASINASIGGSALSLPAGDVKVTIGVDFRREKYDLDAMNFEFGFPTQRDGSRDIKSAYFETLVPILGDDGSGTRRQALDLSLAVRHEDYSDFGGTTNPKIGISWTPLADLRLRSTYGTSFRAPSFGQLDTSNNVTVLTPFPDPDFEHLSLALFQFGKSDDYAPEKSESWDVGIDWTPESLQGFRVVADYFHTKFKDKFQQPSTTVIDILANEAVYASIVTRNPSPALISSIVANPGAGGFIDDGGGALATDATVLINNREQNIGVTLVTGMDVSLSQRFEWNGTEWHILLDGTRTLKFRNQLTPQSSALDITGTLFNPPKWRARGGISASRGALQGAVFASFVPSYKNDQISPTGTISSWTTVDASFGFASTSTTSEIFQDLALRFNVQNLLDRDPPHVASFGNAGVLPVSYDAANASAVGRFVNMEISKRF